MSVQGQEIAKVTSYTYLGVEIDANLSKSLHGPDPTMHVPSCAMEG